MHLQRSSDSYNTHNRICWGLTITCVWSCRLEYEQRKDFDGPIKKLTDTLANLKEDLVKVQGRETQVKVEMEEFTEQLERFREELQELRGKAEAIEEEIQELKKRGSDDTSRLGNVKRQMTAKVSLQICDWLVIESIVRNRRHSIFVFFLDLHDGGEDILVLFVVIEKLWPVRIMWITESHDLTFHTFICELSRESVAIVVNS